MTHDELLAKLSNDENGYAGSTPLQRLYALRAVVELHKPTEPNDWGDSHCTAGCYYLNDDRDLNIYLYPCPTIQAIEKELK